MRVARRQLFYFLLFTSYFLLYPLPSFAFAGDLLISDQDFTDANAMTLADVQKFLQDQNSSLAYHYLPDSSGNLKFPAEIIWFAAQEANVSPKTLLTTLQKEQRTVTAQNLTQRQIDFAMGYGCPDGGGCSDRFRGFGKQVRGAALQFRGYLDDLAQKGETVAKWAVGRLKRTGDGFDIMPKNAATAALYSYTPWRGGSSENGVVHVGGNFSFVRIFRQWFLGGAWPDGTVLQAPDGTRWLIRGGKRRKFATPAVFAERIPTSSAILAAQEEIEAYQEGALIRFPDYSIIQSPDGIRWLLVGEARRKIASRDVFRKLGFNPEEVEDATFDDLAVYTIGSPITKAGQDPRGTFVQERGTKNLFMIVGDTRQPILDQFLANLLFDGEKPTVKTTKELKKLKLGKPVLLPDGVIVTSPKYLPQVFTISRGQRRPFSSPRTLELLGYQWSDVHHIPNTLLDLHPLGAAIEGALE